MDMESRDNKTLALDQRTAGVWYAVAAFSAWGLLPIYWKILKDTPAIEIFSHRILWSLVFVSIMVSFQERWGGLKSAFANPKTRIAVLLSALMIGANWLLYIWAVNSDHIVESSMGYYINPLLSVFLGMLFLKERLNFWQIVALCLALTGVIIITAQYGTIPWISLLLAATFALYGLFKKIANIESIVGLTLETAILLPIAIGYLATKQLTGTAAFGSSLATTLFLICSGIVTATPLIWFAKAVNRAPLSIVGFTQYISPSISLFLGVFIYRESFSYIHMISFGFIWAALILFSLSQTSFMSKTRAV